MIDLLNREILDSNVKVVNNKAFFNVIFLKCLCIFFLLKGGLDSTLNYYVLLLGVWGGPVGLGGVGVWGIWCVCVWGGWCVLNISISIFYPFDYLL